MTMKSPRKSLLWGTLAALLAARVSLAQNSPPSGPPPASNPAPSPTAPSLAGDQEPAAAPAPQNKISTTTTTVVVPVTVKDKRGNMVPGLRRDVDTSADLRAALALGSGPRTCALAAVLLANA